MKKALLSFLLIALSFLVRGQEHADPKAIANTPGKSALSYEQLTQFFQANISSGASGGYDFKSTLFGIKKFFSKDSLNASSIYLKRPHERNLEFTLGLHKGVEGNYDLLTGGLKYALVNHRDKSEYNFSAFNDGALSKNIHLVLKARDSSLRVYEREIGADPAKNKELDAADERFKKSQDIKEYPGRVQDLYNSYLRAAGKDPADFLQSLQDIYDKTAKEIEQRGLLTVSFFPGYDWNHSRLDTTTLNVQYQKGFGNYKKPWNVDLRGTWLLQHDTLSAKKDLSRSVLVATAGINKILVYNSRLNPAIELELAYEDDYVIKGRYPGEDRNQPKLVKTLRVHVSKEISLPLTLKYDLTDPDLFGVFRFQWDF